MFGVVSGKHRDPKKEKKKRGGLIPGKFERWEGGGGLLRAHWIEVFRALTQLGNLEGDFLLASLETNPS